MISIATLTQAAAEYGAATGQAAGSTQGDGARTFVELYDIVTANPMALVVVGVTLLLVIGLFKTRGYRS